jgi:hypothetical protein
MTADVDALIRRAYNRGCEVTMAAGRKCCEPVVATIAGKRVCAQHEASAHSAAEYIASVIRRTS